MSMRPTEALPSFLTPEQRRLVDASLPLVERCAADLASRFVGLLTAADLLGPGTVALHEAARTYRDDLGASFTGYAQHHVYGRMVDAIRVEHFSLRARVELAMERAYARLSESQALGTNLFTDSEEKLLTTAREGCEDVLAAAFLAGTLAAEQASPEETLVERQEYAGAIDDVRDAVKALRPHEKAVIDLVYREGKTLDEVGEAVKVHPNTAQRRHVSALRRLRGAMAARGVTRAPRVVDIEGGGGRG